MLAPILNSIYILPLLIFIKHFSLSQNIIFIMHLNTIWFISKFMYLEKFKKGFFFKFRMKIVSFFFIIFL